MKVPVNRNFCTIRGQSSRKYIETLVLDVVKGSRTIRGEISRKYIETPVHTWQTRKYIETLVLYVVKVSVNRNSCTIRDEKSTQITTLILHVVKVHGNSP